MAAYDYASGGFPTSPVTNDTLAINGTSYIYNGSAWEVVGGSGSGSLYTESATAPASPANGDLWLDTDDDTLYQRQTSAWVQVSTTNMPVASEGTDVLSTGETGGTKYLREDGDGTSSWQPVAGGGIGSFIDSSIAISSDDTALANDDGTANANIGIGTSAGKLITTGNKNISIGTQASQNTTTGYQNVAIGYRSSYSGVGTGFFNTAIGAGTAFYLSSGRNNSVIGYYSGANITTGSYNAALGADALRGNAASKLTGSYNTGIGYQTGYNLTTGQNNVLNGYQTGYGLTSGLNNVCIGKKAGFSTTGGYGNVLVGQETGNGLGGGVRNVAIGEYALQSASPNVSYNVALGYQAGYGETSDNKLHIAKGSAESLIEGDFAAKTVNINGTLTVNGAAVGGAMELISTQTVSSSITTLEFTNISGYTDYELRFKDCYGAAFGGVLYLKVSLDNGSTFQNVTTLRSMKTVSTSGTASSSVYFWAAQSNINIAAGINTTTAGKPNFAGVIKLINNGSTNPIIQTEAHCQDRGVANYGHETTSSSLVNEPSTPINCLHFWGGTFNSGTFSLYGIKDS